MYLMCSLIAVRLRQQTHVAANALAQIQQVVRENALLYGLPYRIWKRPQAFALPSASGKFTPAGAVTSIQNVVCENAVFANNPYCRSRSIWKSILSAVLPPLLLTLWQNLCMPQLIYRGTQVSSHTDSSKLCWRMHRIP